MSTVEVIDGLERKLTIEVPVENVKKAFEKIYNQVRGQANIKGFRKGKAPLSVIRQMYKERVTGDVLQDIINDTYQEALKEHNLVPVAQPSVDFKDISEDKSFSYTATLEIRPDIQLKNYEGLKVKKEKLSVDENLVENTIKDMQKNFAETTPLLEDRPSQEGDIVVIDFNGLMNNEPLEGAQGVDHQLELGSNTFIPGFEEGLVGLKVGQEKDLHLSFPEDYHVADIAGKPIVFNVKIKSILKKALPELNDEFAQKIDAQYKTVEDLRKKIRDNIEQREKERIDGELKERVLKALVEANPVEVPKSLHQAQKKHMMEDLKRKMSYQSPPDFNFDEYAQKWDEDFNETSSFIIQSNYLVSELADKLELHAKPEDVDKKLENYSQSTGYSLQQLKEHYYKPENFSQIHYQVTEEKVVDFLISKAQVSEVEKEKL